MNASFFLNDELYCTMLPKTCQAVQQSCLQLDQHDGLFVCIECDWYEIAELCVNYFVLSILYIWLALNSYLRTVKQPSGCKRNRIFFPSSWADIYVELGDKPKNRPYDHTYRKYCKEKNMTRVLVTHKQTGINEEWNRARGKKSRNQVLIFYLDKNV